MTYTDLFLDQHLDMILRASGSALKNYSMQKSKDDMRTAMRLAVEAGNDELRAEITRLQSLLDQRQAVLNIPAMAKVLSDQIADACGVDCEDNWKIYGQNYIEDVQAMLLAGVTK